jgi:broad specificity phosphatase PhoE
MRARVERGFRKALFLSGGQPGIVLIGHQAVNRMILSLFLYRRTEDVPYIYVPQDQCFHIVATHRKKLFELVGFNA